MKQSTLRPGARVEDGQAMIELALVFPVFFLLLFGLFSFALVFFGWCNITFATRAAARYASVHSNTSLNPATTASVTAMITPFLVTSSTATTTVTYSSANTIGSSVTVTVTAQYGVVMPFTSYSSFTVGSVDRRNITR